MTTLTAGPAQLSQAEIDIRRRLRADRRNAFAKSIGRSSLNGLITLIIVVAIWQSIISFTSISPYVAKGPVQVWNYLFVDNPERPNSTALMHRELLAPLVLETLRNSLLGFAVGMLVAVIFAVLFSISKTVEAGVMPLALLLRSIPLVSMAPVIILLTGRGTPASVAVIGSIVVLFPALASVLFGLSQASKESLDLVRVYGGGTLTSLMKVSIPGALPSLFAAARVSVPGAVTGALLAEWLSTGTGIGGSIQKFNASAQFEYLWSSVALITFITLFLYNIVQLIENTVLARMGMSSGLR